MYSIPFNILATFLYPLPNPNPQIWGTKYPPAPSPVRYVSCTFVTRRAQHFLPSLTRTEFSVHTQRAFNNKPHNRVRNPDL